MTTFTQTLAWCTWYAELAHSAHSCTPVHVVSHFIVSRFESCHFISIVIHERTSLSRFSSSTSTCPSLSSSFPSTFCTASCTLSSTTWSPWKACATPPTRGVTTPTTSPPPSQCPDIWIRLPKQKWLESWSSMEDPVVPLERNLCGHPLAGLLWKGNLRKSYWTMAGRNSKLGMSLCTSWKRIILICVCVDDIKIGWKETQYWTDVESTQQRSWVGRTNIFPGSCILGMYSKKMWK